MNSDLQVFDYHGSAVRTIDKDGEIWFMAKDLCDILELSDVSMTVRSLDEDEKLIQALFVSGQVREVMTVNEPGLYSLIFKSRKPEAKLFSRWVTHEVLPQIRKTGSYSVKDNQEVSTTDAVSAARIIFESAGIKGNQCALALDRVYRSYTGRSALDTGNITLTAPTNNQLLTPTEIGRRFGLKAKRVNQILAGAGFQHKVNDTWEAIGRGNEFAVMVDVGKKYGNGTAVRQLKWDSSILDVFDELRKED